MVSNPMVSNPMVSSPRVLPTLPPDPTRSAGFTGARRRDTPRQDGRVATGRAVLVILLFDVDRPDVVRSPDMFSTVNMAVYMEWSWLLYLCMPLRPTGWMLGASASSYLRMVATLSLYEKS